MKALIMAAGYGTRLEPLTLAVPKPMVPIVNLPTMQHNIELLRRYGFNEIAANIHYHPEQIENYFGDGSHFGANLRYSYEKELLGTAGGVKRMAGIMRVRHAFVVLSSDALTDINLKQLVNFHKKNKALATIALCRVPDVSQFGVVLQDNTGRVIGFQEKPKPEDAGSDLANAGIYVFEPEILKMIPDGFFDFGKELFPKLAAEKARIYGYPMIEYWNDVGSLGKYIQSSYDAMKGLVRIRIPGRRIGRSTWLGNRVEIDRSARFEGSVIIGDNCRIGKDVYIRDSVIGDKCVIEDGALILGSVLWSDNLLGNEAQVTGSVIGNWCHLEPKVKVLEGSIISNRSIIRKATEVPPRSRIEPNSII